MSNVYSFLRINLVEVVRKLATDCEVDDATLEYVLKRLSSEGIRFLTVTLPKLSKAVIRGLETGSFDPPTDFQKSDRKGKSLRYFRSFLVRIFDQYGSVHKRPSVSAIRNLRQFCEYFYKLALDFDEAQLRQAESSYVKIEQEIADAEEDLGFVDSMRKNIEKEYGLMGSTVIDIFKSSRPRFGPGSFFGSERILENFAVHKNLSASVIGLCRKDQKPFSGYFKAYPGMRTYRVYSDSDVGFSSNFFVDEGRKSQVLFVPKDSRGPRVISKEPMHLLRGQMAFFDWLSQLLEKSTRNRINFLNQDHNRDLARKGSIDGSWSTLDLKEASDRVSLALCKKLFRNIPSIWYFITKQRSTHATLPISGDEILLKKLSGMGSGITFPTMALIIHSAVCTQVQRQTGLPYKEIGSSVYVYGDDVIVPRKWFNSAILGITRANLRVNADKSFNNGPFRESCGGDYVNGGDVTPIRLKLAGCGLGRASEYRDGSIRFKKGNQTSAGLLQIERHCRELMKSGLQSTAMYFYERLRVVLGPLPYVTDDDSRLGVYTPIALDTVGFVDQSYIPGPLVKKNESVCPYKALASFFRQPKLSKLESLVTPSRTHVFGEISIPRRIKIRKRRESAIERFDRLFM